MKSGQSKLQKEWKWSKTILDTEATREAAGVNNKGKEDGREPDRKKCKRTYLKRFWDKKEHTEDHENYFLFY